MSVRVWTDRVTKRLRYGDDARTSPRVADGFAHQLLYGLISEPSHVGQKLAVMHEIGP
jgi:hypothetical protein